MFRKFKLVPIDAEGEHQKKNIEEIEKALREYNPTTRAMANLYGGIHDALFSKDKKKSKTISANERLHLVAANRMRMHRLLQGSNEAQTRFQEMSNEDSQRKVVDEETNGDLVKDEMVQKIKEKKEPEEEEQMQLFGESQRSNLAIPTRYGKKFTQLAKIISGTIGSNRLGEVIIRGETLRNTSYSDVMRALYVDSKFTIPGLVETVAELKRLGVKTPLFTSRNARQLYSVPASDKLYLQQKGSGGSIGQKTIPRMLRLY